MIITTRISRNNDPNPAPVAIYNVRPLSANDNTTSFQRKENQSIDACKLYKRVSGNAYVC